MAGWARARGRGETHPSRSIAASCSAKGSISTAWWPQGNSHCPALPKSGREGGSSGNAAESRAAATISGGSCLMKKPWLCHACRSAALAIGAYQPLSAAAAAPPTRRRPNRTDPTHPRAQGGYPAPIDSCCWLRAGLLTATAGVMGQREPAPAVVHSRRAPTPTEEAVQCAGLAGQVGWLTALQLAAAGRECTDAASRPLARGHTVC